MSFSYGRALQQSALKNWAKNIKDTSNTQKIFNHRSKMNGLATTAKWNIKLENQVSTQLKLKKFIYLISPKNIKGNKFYRELDLVLKTNKVKFFQ